MSPKNSDTALFRQYLDGDLDDDASAALEARFDEEPALLEAFEAFAEGTLGDAAAPTPLDVIDAPSDIARGAEAKIRHRSRGRFFNDDLFYRTRIPFEAFAAVVMIAIGMVYLMGDSLKPTVPLDNAMAGQTKTTGNGTEGPPHRPKPELAPGTRKGTKYRLVFENTQALSAKIDALRSAGLDVSEDGARFQLQVPKKDTESFLKKYGTGTHKLIREPAAQGESTTIVFESQPQ